MYIITKMEIIQALNNGVAEIIEDMGIRCRIGEYSFYFDGIEGDELTLEEFLKEYSTEEIAELIVNAIGTEELAEDSGIYSDEWYYYYYFLTESIINGTI